jgi:hypothetical protein
MSLSSQWLGRAQNLPAVRFEDMIEIEFSHFNPFDQEPFGSPLTAADTERGTQSSDPIRTCRVRPLHRTALRRSASLPSQLLVHPQPVVGDAKPGLLPSKRRSTLTSVAPAADTIINDVCDGLREVMPEVPQRVNETARGRQDFDGC